MTTTRASTATTTLRTWSNSATTSSITGRRPWPCASSATISPHVRKNQLSTCEGMGYLEAKHHLLLSYCQGLVYYLLCQAKGQSVDGHPVARNLVEIRMFLDKLLRAGGVDACGVGEDENLLRVQEVQIWKLGIWGMRS